jgi:Ser/Thr protein kinase RdoA (MazF antagonist)
MKTLMESTLRSRRVLGVAPDEITLDEFEQLGRLLARIHNVSATLSLANRPEISPATYGQDCLETILQRTEMPAGLRGRYVDCVERLIDIGKLWFESVESLVVHGDCHRGNLLRGGHGWFFLDFDDMG